MPKTLKKMKTARIIIMLLIIGSVMFTKSQANAHPEKAASPTLIKDTTKKASPASPQASVIKGSMKPYLGNTYIFDRNFQVYGCNAVGQIISNAPIIIYKHFLFQVVDVYIVNKETFLVIKFNEWSKSDYTDRLAYNFNPTVSGNDNSGAAQELLAKQKETEENAKYFVISQTDFSSVCSQYISPRATSITFGTFTTPFKFRPTKSLFASDLTLGTVAYFNLKLNDNLSYGLATGISLTSVTLDSLSTNGKVKTTSDRPALTPSESLVVTYKGISFTIGTGIDYINKTSEAESSWIFNGKPWIGFGIGVNLFGTTPGSNTTTADSNQSK
jgi:hypothetical protein